jgi:phosphatidate cytidylyltransferase
LARDLADAGSFRWGDLRKRIASAAILAPLALVAIWLGAAAWAAVIALVTLGLAFEWVRLCGFRVSAFPGVAVPGAVFVAGAAAVAEHEAAALVLLLAGFAALWALARRVPSRVPEREPGSSANLAAGVLYVGLACIAIVWLRNDPVAGRHNVLFLVLIVWASDVGAYLAGRLIGGPRLAPRISPRKTWAGAIGGLAAGIGIGFLVAASTPDGGGLWRIGPVAAFLAAVAQIGDLIESLIKRRFGVKDSSGLIPGHGGLLDRLDGMLTAAPAAALLALAIGRGVVLWR